MDIRDPGLDALLDLDDVSFTVDAAGRYRVRFVVKEVASSPQRPHGLSYSLTLYHQTGGRLVGFDNAHAPPARTGRSGRVRYDHRHRLRTIRPYEYRDAATLLVDFWAEVYAVLEERGESP